MEDKNIEPQEGGGLGINIEPQEEEIDVQSVKTQEEIKELLEELPEDLSEEEVELSEEEQKEQYIKMLKESRIKFHPTKNPVKTTAITTVPKPYGAKFRDVREKTREVATNETVNQFDKSYKKKRKRKNTLAKKSRKANR